MVTASLSLYCPPMKIFKISRKLHRTDTEPMTATVTINGQSFQIENVTIPPTDVNRIKLGKWKVNKCVGATPLGMLPSMIVNLPEEGTDVSCVNGEIAIIAEKIIATVKMKMLDGSNWEGTVTFPACSVSVPLPGHPSVAAAITAPGSLTQTG